MQLAYELGLVPGLAQLTRQRVLDLPGHAVPIGHHAVGDRLLAGKKRAPRRDAGGAFHVGAGEVRAGGGEEVEIGGADHRMPVDAQAVAAMLIGSYQQDVGLPHGKNSLLGVCEDLSQYPFVPVSSTGQALSLSKDERILFLHSTLAAPRDHGAGKDAGEVDQVLDVNVLVGGVGVIAAHADRDDGRRAV